MSGTLFGEVNLLGLKGGIPTVTPDNFLNVAAFGRPIVIESFDKILDTTNRWDEVIVGSATQSQPANSVQLDLNVTAGATDSITETFKGEDDLRGIPSGFQKMIYSVSFGSLLLTGNRREWGYTDTDGLNGIFFRIDGTSMALVTLKGGAEVSNDLTSFLPNSDFHTYTIEQQGPGLVIGSLDGTKIIELQSPTSPLVGDLEKKPFMRMFNTGALGGPPSPTSFQWLMLFDQSDQGARIYGVDDNGNIRAAVVNETGRLLISQNPPTPPPATTAVIQQAKSTMSGTQDLFFIITNGKTLTIQSLSAGAEVSNAGSIVELFEDLTGTGTPLNLVEDIYVAGQSFQKILNSSFVGDGTRRILLRRRNFSGGMLDVTGIWTGFEA